MMSVKLQYFSVLYGSIEEVNQEVCTGGGGGGGGGAGDGIRMQVKIILNA